MTENLKSKLAKEFEYSVQAFTMCEECGYVDWCVVRDVGKELCKGCYITD